MSYDYEGIKDEEIIDLIKKGDNMAMDYLLEKYSSLVRRISRTMYIMGADSEDLIQEGMIGLFKAIRDYSGEKGSSFFGFAKMCIKRQVYTAVTASNRKKHIPLNSYISIYLDDEEKEDGIGAIGDLLEARKDFDPEQRLLGKEKIENINKTIKENLSNFEKKVLELYLDGLTYMDISKKINKPLKAIDNAIQRIRAKLVDIQI